MASRMSEGTVKAHVSRALAKLGLSNRVQVALLVHDARQLLEWMDLTYAIDLNGMNSSLSTSSRT